MNLLIDTHIFIWSEISVGKIKSDILAELVNSNNEIFMSLVSIWEMQIKIQLGRLTFPKPLIDIVENQKLINNIRVLPITEEHIYHLSNLPHHHSDPFDRLIVAQSLSENLLLVSDDSIFLKYGVNLL
jgi:PIN domain nuclease of toxin-antitoxin system